MIIVADASPLVALATCDCLDLLERLFDELKVSKAVFDEVTVNGKPGAEKLSIFLEGKVEDINLDDYIITGSRLDLGELTAIALCKKLHADYLLIDERAGRRVAKINSIKVIGSLGILVQAKRRNLLPAIKPYIEILRSSKTHFSESLLDSVLSTVGE